jgi:ABC-2 type transport system ATP-binding protein
VNQYLVGNSENKEEIFIEFHNISKSYKDVKALDNISFHIQKGEIFGYIGPNGAGKTTTLKILVGLIKDFDGKVLINGRFDDRKKFHQILGYLPQEVGFQEWRTVNHALKTFGRLSGVKSENLDAQIEKVLEMVALSDVRDKKIVHLSGGMKQKLKLAQALVNDPDFLVLDEPMSGLDPTSRFQMKNIIMKLAKSGKTIFFSSHILNDVQDIANRIGILHKGKIVKEGTPHDLQRDFQVGNTIQIIYSEKSNKYNDFEELKCIGKVKEATSNIQLLQLESETDLDVCIKEILKKLLEHGCAIRNFNLLKPSLEDVYLKYVGGETA